MKSIAEQVTMSIPPKDDKAFRITVNDEEQKLTELFAIPGKAMAGAEHEARFGTKGPRVLFGSVDPRHRGVDAPVGSLYSNTTDGTLYSKVGKGIEQWRAHVFK